MKLNPSLYPDKVGFHHEVISSESADLFRRKTDLVEKSTSKEVLFSGGERGIPASQPFVTSIQTSRGQATLVFIVLQHNPCALPSSSIKDAVAARFPRPRVRIPFL